MPDYSLELELLDGRWTAYRMDPFVVELPLDRYSFHVGLVRKDTDETVAAYPVVELRVGLY